MAKRKRLGAVDPAGTTGTDRPGGAGDSGLASSPLGLRPPIARVAGDTATAAAFDEVAGELRQAREEGRLILSLPLDAIAADHLLRDRLELEDEALVTLKQSLIARGQQTPIEVTALPPAADGRPRYGLISGWRRLHALRALAAETEEARFQHVQALLRRPRDQTDAYVAMVEENEIRADLSFFERARIVAQSLDAGVFDSEKQALQSLFANASYPRRSKIKSFIAVVRALEGALRFPARLSERRGLALAAELARDPQAGARIAAALAAEDPQTPEAEATVIERILSRKAKKAKTVTPPPDASLPDLHVDAKPGRIVLSGPAATPDLIADLRDWLRARS